MALQLTIPVDSLLVRRKLVNPRRGKRRGPCAMNNKRALLPVTNCVSRNSASFQWRRDQGSQRAGFALGNITPISYSSRLGFIQRLQGSKGAACASLGTNCVSRNSARRSSGATAEALLAGRPCRWGRRTRTRYQLPNRASFLPSTFFPSQHPLLSPRLPSA